MRNIRGLPRSLHSHCGAFMGQRVERNQNRANRDFTEKIFSLGNHDTKHRGLDRGNCGL